MTIKECKEAARNGDLELVFSAAVYYMHRENDWNEAFPRFEIAAEHGHEQSQLILGNCYLEGFDLATEGFGLNKNLEKAVYWWEKAAAQGNPNAKNQLDVYEKDSVNKKEAAVAPSTQKTVKTEPDTLNSKATTKQKINIPITVLSIAIILVVSITLGLVYKTKQRTGDFANVGASTQNIGVSTRQENITDSNVYQAYYDILQAAIDKHGEFDSMYSDFWNTTIYTGVQYAELVDFNNDGILELIFTWTSDEGGMPGGAAVCLIYGYTGEEAILYFSGELVLSGYGPKSISIVKGENNVKYFILAGQHSGGEILDYYTLENNAWVLSLSTETGRYDVYEVNGKSVTKEEYTNAAKTELGITSDIDSNCVEHYNNLDSVKTVIAELEKKLNNNITNPRDKTSESFLTANDDDFKQLEDFISYCWPYGEPKFSFKTTKAEDVLNYVITDICDLTFVYYHFFGPKYDTFEDVRIDSFNGKDPLGRYNIFNWEGCLKLPSQNVDWILENIFNVKPDHTINSDESYYHDGYYYRLYGGGGGPGFSAKIEKATRLSDGKYRIICFREHEPDAYAQSFTNELIVALKEIDGKKYWSFYEISHGSDNVSSQPLKNPDNYDQKIVVTSSGTSATVQLYDWTDGGWNEIFKTTNAKVGKNGVGADYGEGKGITPKGQFDLCFSYALSKPDTKLYFKQVTKDSVFVDDPNSHYYNMMVDKNILTGESYEDTYNLFAVKKTYSACILIGSNGDGITPGSAIPHKGSVIGLNGVNGSLTATTGDVNISSSDMAKLLPLLDSSKNPQMIIK